MPEMPAAPDVSAVPLDPVVLSRRINDLEDKVQTLENENGDLKSKLAKQTSATGAARGLLSPMREELESLRAKLSASENLKELARLKAEVSKMHAERAKGARAQAEVDRKTKAQVDELTLRATRAEGKFLALEGTATMMAQARDRANESAAAMLAERDQARKRVEELEIDLKEGSGQFVKQRAELEQALAELKALRSGKAK